ncbi:glutathione S-transferase [Xylariales sp. PMI_506]|nr:glutathione S-transferase [Xylariales sp. PMI_506]
MATPPSDKIPQGPGLYVYGAPAVNPYKLTILCEELAIPYKYISIDNVGGEQKSEWYTKINPNGRLPAIIHVKEDGTSMTIWESAPCMLYIVSEFDKRYEFSHQPGSQDYWHMVAWLTWQVAGQGPMMGQAAHFVRYATESVPYGVNRYTAECRRLFQVLEQQLSHHSYVAGSRLTVADIAIFIWVITAAWCGVEITEFPTVRAWRDGIWQRPAVKKGLKVPVPYPFSDDRVLDPRRKKFFDMVQVHGKEVIKRELEELTKGTGRGKL